MFKNIDLAWREQKVPVPNTDGCIRGCWPQVGLAARFLCFSWEIAWWEQNWWSAKIFIGFACSSLSPGSYQLAHPYPVLASGGWLGGRSIHGVYNADQAFPVFLALRGVSVPVPWGVWTSVPLLGPLTGILQHTSTHEAQSMCIPLQRRKVLSIWLIRGDRRVCNPWGRERGRESGLFKEDRDSV